MSIPELIIMYMLTDKLLDIDNKMNRLLIVSIIYAPICFVVKNVLPINIHAFMIIFINFILYNFYSKQKITKFIISFVTAYGMKFICEVPLVMFLNLMKININYILNIPLLKITSGGITLVLYYLIYKLIKNKDITLTQVRRHNLKDEVSKDKYLSNILIIMAIVNVMMMGIIVTVSLLSNNSIFGKYDMLLLVLSMISATCLTLLVIVISIIDKSRDLAKIENILITKHLKQMEETVDLLRIQRHDYMNHLQVILMQISNDKSEDAKKYISRISENVKSGICIFDTNNNYLDAILNLKNTKCLEYDIELTANIDYSLEKTTLDEIQLSSIFLNIIDNAIDELKKTDLDFKFIHIDTYKDDNTCNISIKNNGPIIPNTEKIFEKGYSSKGSNRGFGLYSIKKLLEKNKCIINVISDEEETEFNIKIPINS